MDTDRRQHRARCCRLSVSMSVAPIIVSNPIPPLGVCRLENGEHIKLIQSARCCRLSVSMSVAPIIVSNPIPPLCVCRLENGEHIKLIQSALWISLICSPFSSLQTHKGGIGLDTIIGATDMDTDRRQHRALWISLICSPFS